MDNKKGVSITKSPFSTYAPYAILGGLALGATARAGKGLYDLFARSDTESEELGSESELVRPTTVEVPIEVTPEEEAKLKRKGVKVAAGLFDPIANAAALTGSTIGGWWLIDRLMKKYRGSAAKGEVKQLRDRVQKLLDTTPDVEDEAVGQAIKTAAEAATEGNVLNRITFGLYDKALNFGSRVGGRIKDEVKSIATQGFQAMVPSSLATVAGGAAVLTALAAYNRAREQNKLLHKEKAIKKLLQTRREETPAIVLKPVRKKRKPSEAVVSENA